MSLDNITSKLELISNLNNWQIYAIKFRTKNDKIEYKASPLNFESEVEATRIVNAMVANFNDITLKKKKYTVEEYTGYNPDSAICKIPINDEMIKESLLTLDESILNEERNEFVTDQRYNSYLIKGVYETENNKIDIKFITIKTPFYNYRNKKMFKLKQEVLKPLDDTILNFACYFDILILNDILYLINHSGETFLNIEKHYKKKCRDKLHDIERADFISNYSCFSEVVSKGQYPRYFISFSDSRFEMFKDPARREEASRISHLRLNADGHLEVENAKDSLLLLKTLCYKTLNDPYEGNKLCEVSNVKPME